MERVEKFLDKYWWLVLIVLSTPTFWALLVPGFYGASDDLHIAWLHQMHQTILSGKIPPRFVPDLSFGFGYPLFNFVFPLPFYMAEIFHLTGASLVDSIKLLFLLTIPLSGIAMCILLRQFVGVWLSLAGAILYIYTPYRAVDLYIRGAIGEILSFVFLPLILFSVVKMVRDKSFQLVGLGGLMLASLVLSHNITAYMFFPAVLLFAVLMVIFVSADKKATTIRLGISLFLAFLISSYFWLPAILESSLMKYETVFNFADHFPTIRQLLTPYWGYGASVPGPYDGMSFFLGTINLVVTILATVLFFFNLTKFSKVEKVIIYWALICLMTAIFLMNYRSLILWQNVPLLPYFQFPWRFLMIVTLVTPILVIVLSKFKYQKYLAMLIIILAVGLNASYFHPEDFLGRGDDYYLNRYIPTPRASEEYLKIQEEYLRLPKDSKQRPDQNYPLVTSNDLEIKNVKKMNSLDSLIEVYSQKGGTLTYNKYFFPGWEVRIDGKHSFAMPGEPFGQIIINIPSGNHRIEISFAETTFKKILDAISLVSIILAILLIFKLNLFNILKSGKIRMG